MPPQTLTLRLPVRSPFAADAMLGFLATHVVPGVEQVQGRSYTRSLRLPGGTGTVVLTLPEDGADGTTTDVRASMQLDDPADSVPAVAHCRKLLDLDANPAATDSVLAADPALAAAVTATPGLRVPGAMDGPEILVRAMLGQQVSVAGAHTAAGRLVAAADERLPNPTGNVTHLFPSPASIASLGPGMIAGPRRRALAITAAAAAIAEGSLVVDANRPGAELTADLLAQPGIGPWTAGYVTMRLHGSHDVLLTGDLVLRKGAALLGLPSTPAALTARSSQWRPYRSYAGMHLWRAALAHRAAARPATDRSTPMPMRAAFNRADRVH